MNDLDKSFIEAIAEFRELIDIIESTKSYSHGLFLMTISRGLLDFDKSLKNIKNANKDLVIPLIIKSLNNCIAGLERINH